MRKETSIIISTKSSENYKFYILNESKELFPERREREREI
jgi:hypothetical protein